MIYYYKATSFQSLSPFVYLQEKLRQRDSVTQQRWDHLMCVAQDQVLAAVTVATEGEQRINFSRRWLMTPSTHLKRVAVVAVGEPGEGSCM